MARPIKDGVDYFPLDVCMDEKIGLLEAEYGVLGFGILIKLYQRIYARGYFCLWNQEVALLFGRECNVPAPEIEAIVGAAVGRGIFDKRLLRVYGILTSRGIQARYFAIVSRRAQVVIEPQYLLTGATDAAKAGVLADKSTQRKENKTKEKKTKATEQLAPEGAQGCFDYQGVQDLFLQLCPSLPRVRAITQRRRQLILQGQRLLQKQGEDFAALFARVEESDFLTGRKGDWNGCGFDWILKPSNLIKVLEGQYANKGQPSYKLGDFEKFNVFDIQDGN